MIMDIRQHGVTFIGSLILGFFMGLRDSITQWLKVKALEPNA